MKTTTFRTLSLVLFFAFLFFSCKEDTPSTRLLQQAQEQADTHPKKALQLLDSIKDPKSMDKESYMKYIIARTQAKYEAKQDISEDTLVFEAQRYFENKNNPKESALANFYTGNVYYENSITEKALEHFLKASSLAQQNNDNILTGRSLYNIGYQYYKQALRDSTITYYLRALSYFEKEDNTELFRMQTIYELGSVYYAIHNLEQAYSYFKTGLELAQQIDNKKYQSRFIHSLGVVYREQGKYQQASTHLHTALGQTTSPADSLRVYLNLSHLYNYMNLLDSAGYYTDRMKNRLSEISDIYTLRNIYASFSEYNRQEGNYSEALRYADLKKEIRQKIKEENKALELLEADKKVILEQKNKEIQRQKAENNLYLVGGLLFIILFVLLMIYLFLGSRKESKRMQKEIDYIKNIRNLPYDWESIKWSMDTLNNDPLGREIIPILRSNKDIQIVALSMNGYSKAVIAGMLNIPLQSVEQSKTDIRRLLTEAGYSDEQIGEILKV